jgi:hypothetical protein
VPNRARPIPWVNDPNRRKRIGAALRFTGSEANGGSAASRSQPEPTCHRAAGVMAAEGGDQGAVGQRRLRRRAST